jgi:hypothetical protein
MLPFNSPKILVVYMNKYRLLPEMTKLPVELITGNEFVVGNTSVPSTLRLPVM